MYHLTKNTFVVIKIRLKEINFKQYSKTKYLCYIYLYIITIILNSNFKSYDVI